ncbi:type IV secretion system protein [Salmonella enterica subsp. enterica serovar Newport]|nr:type IV secretion system protein [Salmonella enterica]EDF4265271.1 type IV secretion system protein [Salmonella enterica subsp. enterica serovar Newport]ECH2720083.1 type IV secretion system protein [Salmonella enterica]ECK3727569.1 type IV secretion system protein [Salmonella enterica]ECZ4422848.1 type IV secretion system protein [Salmonella enterica]
MSDKVKKEIEAARSFEEHNLKRDERDKKVGFFIGGTGLFIAILSIIALIVMLPLKQTIVDLYVLDKTAGIIYKVNQFTEEAISTEQATDKVLVASYLELRERYNYFSLQDDYTRVQAYNSDDVNREYLAFWNSKQAPDVVWRKAENTVRIKILTQFITEATDPDKLSTIRYQRIIRNVKTGNERTEIWNARITFRYVPTETLDKDQREINGMGLIITSFENVEESGDVK